MPEEKESKVDTIFNQLRSEIKGGTYGTGGRLPSVAQMIKTYQTSRATIYEVLRLLQSEGLIVSRDNSYVVFVPQMRISGAPLFDKYLEKQGLEPMVDNLIEPEIIQMPKEVSDIFGQPEGVHVVHRMRRHGASGVYIRIAENWYPRQLAEPFLEEMRKNANLNVAGKIREATGLSIGKIKERMIGRLPSHEELKILTVTRTSPLHEIHRTFLTLDDQVILFNRTVLVSAYFILEHEYETGKK